MDKIKAIKNWCKSGYGCKAVKLEKITDGGFIVSKIKEIRAGMESDIHTGRIISLKIRTVRKERIYLHYFFDDQNGDIYGGKVVSLMSLY